MTAGEILRSIMGIGKPRFRRRYDLWECAAMKDGERCFSLGATPKEAWYCFRVLHLPWSFWGSP